VLDTLGQGRAGPSRRLDGRPRGAQRRERSTDQRQAELVRLGRVDDDPRPRLRLDLEPSVLRLPAAATEPAEGVGVRVSLGHRNSIGEQPSARPCRARS
jgi:hypothetical protein